jgi:hypothetical protein
MYGERWGLMGSSYCIRDYPGKDTDDRERQEKCEWRRRSDCREAYNKNIQLPQWVGSLRFWIY